MMADGSWDFLRYAYTGPFLHGFLVLFTPAAIVALLSLILVNRVGRGLGLAKLFRNDDGATGHPGQLTPGRVFVGMGVAAVYWQALFAGYVFEPFATNYSRDRPPWVDRNPPAPGGPPASAASLAEFAGYAAVVLASMAVTAAAFWGLLSFLDRAGTWVSMWGAEPPMPVEEATEPDHPTGRPPSYDWRVSSPPFWIGFGLGVAVLTGLTAACFHGPLRPAAEAAGVSVLENAGYGDATARAWEQARAAGRPTEPASAASADDARRSVIAGLGPYHAAFGVFAFQLALVGAVYALLFAQWFAWRPGLFSPAAGVVFVMQLAVFASVALYQFVPDPGPLRAGAVLAVLLLGGLRLYKLKFPHLDYQRPARLDRYAPEGPADRPPGDAPALGADGRVPFAPRPAGFAPAPLVVVAASGGGSRAAAWATAVMGRLEVEFGAAGIPFPHHVRLVAGASGGMIGMANFVAGLAEPAGRGVGHVPNWPTIPKTLTAERLAEWVRDTGVTRDWLTPICHRMLYFDLPALALPFLLRPDRGRAVEAEWVRDLKGLTRAGRPADGASFADLLSGERDGWRPSLVFTPMMVEDGRQLAVGNLDLRRAMRNLASQFGSDGRLLSRPGVELFRLLGDRVGEGFRVATAARMSATFPYVLPAVPLPTVPPRRVVDAGYYDNYGVQVVGAWLDAHAGWVRANFPGVLFVQIRDSLSGAARRLERPHPADTPSLAWRSLEWASSPFGGLLSARQAATTFRNDNLLDLLDDRFNGAGDPGYFTTAAFEFDRDDEVSLSLRLTGDELAAIAGSACALKGVTEMIKWWERRSDPSANPSLADVPRSDVLPTTDSMESL